MKVFVIGKPVYNITIPLQNFIAEGSKTKINEKLELPGGNMIYTAVMLAKWGLDVSFCGVTGGDEYGSKIKAELESNNINTKYLEINYEHKTPINYVFINSQTGIGTEVLHDDGISVSRYKYDTTPDVIIMDGSDMGSSLAILNNFPNAISILLANRVSEDVYSLSKRCKYVVANMSFAKALTKTDFDFNKQKVLVNMFQKIKDLNKSEYILMLRDKGVLYVNNRQVKMIPAINVKKVDDTNSGSSFFAAYSYGIINKYNMDITAKIANIAGGLAISKLGSILSIPDKKDVFDLIGMDEEKLKSSNEGKDNSNLQNIQSTQNPQAVLDNQNTLNAQMNTQVNMQVPQPNQVVETLDTGADIPKVKSEGSINGQG